MSTDEARWATHRMSLEVEDGMKCEGLTRFQAKRQAQALADKTEQACHIYRQWSVTGTKHFGVVNDRDAKDWQRGASVECKHPRYG